MLKHCFAPIHLHRYWPREWKCFILTDAFKPRANGRNIVGQQLPTLLDVNVASVCTPCCILLDVVACCCAKLKPVKLFSQRLPTFLLFSDRRSVAQQCWTRLHSSPNIVGATLITHGLERLMGCILPTMHCRFQHCWELLHPFARSLTNKHLESRNHPRSKFPWMHEPCKNWLSKFLCTN